MRHRLASLICGVGALVSVFLFAASLFAQDARTITQTKEVALDVTGSWRFQVEIAGTSGTPTMTFKQEGEKLSGEYSGQLGTAPLTGTLKGHAIEFSFDVDIQGSAIHIVYSGTVEKDSMKGTAKYGDLGEGAFTAERKSQKVAGTFGEKVPATFFADSGLKPFLCYA